MNVSFWSVEYLGSHFTFSVFLDGFEVWQGNEERDEAIGRPVFKRDVSLGTYMKYSFLLRVASRMPFISKILL